METKIDAALRFALEIQGAHDAYFHAVCNHDDNYIDECKFGVLGAVDDGISAIIDVLTEKQTVERTVPVNTRHPRFDFYNAHVTLQDDQVVFEWWCKERALNLYCPLNAMEGFKSWGSNIHTEMEDVDKIDPTIMIELSDWLEGK